MEQPGKNLTARGLGEGVNEDDGNSNNSKNMKKFDHSRTETIPERKGLFRVNNFRSN